MLFELLRRNAGAAPDAPAVISPRGALSHSGLLERAERIAAGLRQADIDRFGAVLEEVEDAVAVLCAGAAVGSEPCLYPATLSCDAAEDLAERLGHDRLIGPACEGAPWVRLEELQAREADDGLLISPERAPVLILTTGTTGAQKGARHEWSRLVAGVPEDRASGARWLLAYNPNQFAGIQVILHALAGGGTLVVPPSRRPADVARVMADASVTHASATPTFWRLLVGWLTPQTAQEIPLRQITLGGEAASGSLLERLRDLFPQAKITHIYAGTEFGSAIAVSDGRPGLPESVLEHSDGASVEMRIVAGELQVRSDAGMLGYHGAEDEPSRWHSTGDLVEIRDGRIHFVGRTTEVINVGGAKVHPLPVEEVIAGVAGVVVVSVYGRENPITGNIVAADVVAAPDFREEEIERAIRAACESLPPAARPRRIRFVTEIATQGSKLVRGSGQTP